MNGLLRYGKYLEGKKPFLCTTYQRLLFDTASTFQELEGFLNLDYPLTETYEILTTKWGDPSSNLLSGNINRNQKSKEDVFISARILEEAKFSYEHALTFFSS